MKRTIKEITRFKVNGMYEDKYTVHYANGMRRKYIINGEMINKHFEFMMNAKCEPIIKNDGKHVGDKFII